jgi:hypothetical protein
VTVFQLSVNPSSGAVTIWIEAACGLRPLRVCADLEGVREFGQMLLDFYHARMDEKKRVLEVSENLLRQALPGDSEE